MNDELQYWLDFNTKYSQEWPNITESIDRLPDADNWNGKEGKKNLVSTKPGPEE